jgi:ATP-dependent protease ClpP protease subunit
MTRRDNRYWGKLSVPESKSEFFNAVTTPAPAGEGTVATIRLYGPIDSWGGFWGVSAKDVGAVLDALPSTVEQIVLRINSPGGEVFEGLGILNMLRAHKASVTAVVDGLAASAASVIASACDEVVMSPGTQMMIHSPSVITWGNAVDLRKQADVLDGIERSLVEIYTGKAGEADWAALLADETWMTAAEAVALGLADRVAVVPDAGEPATVGADDEALLILDDEEPTDSAARLVVFAAAARPAAPKLPRSTGPGEPNRKDVTVSDTLQDGIRERLGLTAASTDADVMAALDERLAAPTATDAVVVPPIPAGAVVMDATALEEMRRDAADGRAARAQQISDRRDAVVDSALRSGRITAASREHWRAMLDTDAEERVVALLGEMEPNEALPVDEIGHADGVTDSDDALYRRTFADAETKEV